MRRPSLCVLLLSQTCITNPIVLKYKIELRMRNHNTLSRPQIIEEVAKCVPQTCKVDLDDPEVFILMEIFKVCTFIFCRAKQLSNCDRSGQSVCGIGIVRDYYKLHKFNVMEIAKTGELGFKDGEGRVKDSTEKKNTEAAALAVSTAG
jgi:tRNA acetyltransferase TAN1